MPVAPCRGRCWVLIFNAISRAAGSGELGHGVLAAKSQLSEATEQGRVVPPGVADTSAQPDGQ